MSSVVKIEPHVNGFKIVDSDDSKPFIFSIPTDKNILDSISSSSNKPVIVSPLKNHKVKIDFKNFKPSKF